MVTSAFEAASGGKRYFKVAVLCWFTSTGRAMPYLIRYEDDSQEMRTLRHITVKDSSAEMKPGLFVQWYQCKCRCEEREVSFYLFFRPGENRWFLSFPEG
ncbi:MAG: hypothetical protein KBS83_02610 [Lachnospiraceae bacterium]|nr:hypothetical protein [Candidatus Equihabitans merdae]